jgi:hypothetical protein
LDGLLSSDEMGTNLYEREQEEMGKQEHVDGESDATGHSCIL